MAELADHSDEVVEITGYLRDTIRDIDEAMAQWAARRAGLAARLAVLEAVGDPRVREAAEDYQRRVAENRPYENARPAEDVLKEAHSRYIG